MKRVSTAYSWNISEKLVPAAEQDIEKPKRYYSPKRLEKIKKFLEND